MLTPIAVLLRGPTMITSETVSEFCRRRGVEAIRQGVPADLIAKVLGVSTRSLYKWVESACGTSTEVLTPQLCPRRMTDEQLGELERLLTEGAAAHGWANDLWTAKRVAELINRHFDVTYCANNVWKILTKRMGWSLQRPVQQAKKRDDAAIEEWVNDEYPAILERARRREAYLAFIDESGFMLAPVIRRTYSPRGHSPVIKTADPHGKLSVIGAMIISPNGKRFSFEYHILDDNLNFRGSSIRRFIETIYQKIERPLTILWDDIFIHSSKPVEAYLNEHRRVVDEKFPHYAPELNPVDRVWGYVKYGRLPNYTPPGLEELRERITVEFRRLQEKADLLESLFRATGLPLLRRQTTTAVLP